MRHKIPTKREIRKSEQFLKLAGQRMPRLISPHTFWSRAEVDSIFRLQDTVSRYRVDLRYRDFKLLWESQQGKCAITGHNFFTDGFFDLGLRLLDTQRNWDVNNVQLVLLPLINVSCTNKALLDNLDNLKHLDDNMVRCLFESFIDLFMSYEPARNFNMKVSYERYHKNLLSCSCAISLLNENVNSYKYNHQEHRWLSPFFSLNINWPFLYCEHYFDNERSRLKYDLADPTTNFDWILPTYIKAFKTSLIDVSRRHVGDKWFSRP